MWTCRRIGVLALALFAAPPVAAEDTAALDKLIGDGLKEMHNKAADLYNGGDPNGCYRMFHGGLLTVRPLLAHRPDVQQLIDQGLQAADHQAAVALRAKGLHETIEAVRTKLKPPAGPKPADAGGSDPRAGTPTPSLPQPTPGPPPTPPPAPPGPSLPMGPAAAQPVAATGTLWKRLGDEENVNKIVGDFLTWAVNDEKVNFTRGNKYPLDPRKEAELKQKLVAYVSDISGGTVVGPSSRSMADIHKGMNITGAEFDALAGYLKTSLEKNKVAPADVEEVMRKVDATKKDIVAGGN
jgi:truncated hemoglobin YjbI